MLTWLKQLFKGEKEGEINSAKEGEIKKDNKATDILENQTSKNDSTKFVGVVVGKIMEINDHPNADRLKITKVYVGEETLNIVCGGPNISVGQLVPVALVGAKLANNMEIKPAEIRGQQSFGMICAEDELGLGDGHNEIMVLKSDAVIGGPIDNYIIK